MKFQYNIRSIKFNGGHRVQTTFQQSFLILAYESNLHLIVLYFLILSSKGYDILFLLRTNFDTITVQAPQPPSAHPNFVPHKFTKLEQLRIIEIKYSGAYKVAYAIIHLGKGYVLFLGNTVGSILGLLMDRQPEMEKP